jgi:hypothetical protein
MMALNPPKGNYKCKECYYWVETVDYVADGSPFNGDCHRNPNIVVKLEDDFCGEWSSGPGNAKDLISNVALLFRDLGKINDRAVEIKGLLGDINKKLEKKSIADIPSVWTSIEETDIEKEPHLKKVVNLLKQTVIPDDDTLHIGENWALENIKFDPDSRTAMLTFENGNNELPDGTYEKKTKEVDLVY